MFTDLRFAFRALARSPIFTSVSVLMLGAGIGLAIFMFGAINIYALKPLPFPKADELISIQYTDSETGRRNLSMPLIDWLELRDRQQSMRSLEAYSVGTMSIGGIEGAPERLSGAWVSDDAFSVLGAAPTLGRGFTAEDSRKGAAPVAVIGERVWQLQFNADPNVVGRQMRINGTPTSVIGVMPERFAFPVAESIWMPLSSDRAFAASDAAQDVKAFGRMRDGVSIAQAKSDFAGMVNILASERSEPLRGDAAKVQPFSDEFVQPQIKDANRAMFVAVLLVLLIACANVASLVMARFAARTRELAVRSALGASRRRLIVQVLSETIIISLCATALGWLGATVAGNMVDRYMQSTPAQMPYWLDRSTDLRDVLFAGGIALLSALAAGLLPALRTGRVDVQSVLRQGGGIGERSKLSRVLVAGEVALCMVLLVGSGIAIRSSITAQHTPLGITVDGVLTGRIGLFESSYPDAASRERFVDALQPRLAAIPGVSAVAFASTLPLMGYERQEYGKVGDPTDRDVHLPQAWSSSVSNGFFDVYAIALREGRMFDARDNANSVPVALVSDSLAAAAWPGQSAIGRRVRLSPKDESSQWLEVVGVVSNSLQADYLANNVTIAAHRGDGNIFRPIEQNPPSFVSVALRGDGDVSALANGFQDAVRSVDSDLPVYWLRSMSEWRDRMFWGSDILANLFAVFAAFALLLAVAGIYAVLAFDVAQRSREIGVRRALGANTRGVLSIILRRGAIQVVIGIAIGTPLALVFGRALESMVIAGTAADPLIYFGVAGVLLLAVIAAALIPARRALRVDPMVALRSE